MYKQTYVVGVSAISVREIHLLLRQGVLLKNLLEKLRESEQLIVKFIRELNSMLVTNSIKYLVSEEHSPLFNKLSHTSEQSFWAPSLQGGYMVVHNAALR